MNCYQEVKFDKEYYENYKHTITKGTKPLYYRFWVRYLRKRLPSGRILDAGCGHGFFLKCAEKYYETFGTDISMYGIDQAKRISSKSYLQVGNVYKCGYKDGVFDVVINFDVLEHLEKPVNALREYNRILKIGGLLIISVPNVHSIGKKWKKNKWFGYQDKTHQMLISNDQWINLLEQNGFDINDIFYDGLWDSPYCNVLPTLPQHLIFKIPVAILFWLGYKFPQKFGENICIVGVKKLKVGLHEL